MDTLDITDWKEKGIDLKRAIGRAVEETQTGFLRPLPSILKMTTDQYDMLQHDPDMQQMYQSKDHLYVTPWNVMEVLIKT